MRQSITRPVIQFFAAAISAMLLFEGSAFATTAEPLRPALVPGSPDLLPFDPDDRPGGRLLLRVAAASTAEFDFATACRTHDYGKSIV